MVNIILDLKYFSGLKLAFDLIDFNPLPAMDDLCRLLITFAASLGPDQADQMSGLIWIQTVCHSDRLPEKKFLAKEYYF